MELVIQGRSLRVRVILDGIWMSERRSISVLKEVHRLFGSDSFSDWKLSLKEFISALNCSPSRDDYVQN